MCDLGIKYLINCLDRCGILVVKDIIVFFSKNESILILIIFKRYFSHPEKSILSLSLPYFFLFNTHLYDKYDKFWLSRWNS